MLKLSRTDSTSSNQNFFGSPRFYIFFNYILGAWGDWMWQFAVGLFLVKLGDEGLLLPAIYGFVGGSCVLFFGGIIGDWVDKNPRLRVVITSLVIQNMSVAVSAISVGLTLVFAEQIDAHEHGKIIRRCCEAGIIVTAISAQLASVGYKIAIEKDWIVVVAKGSKSRLANLNAMTRAIDLCFKVLAPMCVGLIMTYASDLASAIVIAAWNIVSVFFEYSLLYKVYSLVPSLAHKGDGPTLAEIEGDQVDEVIMSPIYKEPKPAAASSSEKLKGSGEAAVAKDDDPDANLPLTKVETEEKPKDEPQAGKKKGFFHRVFEPLITLVRGWRTYARQKVVFAGMSLGFLYMTVLGFDFITVGYIYANGVPEWGAAVAMAMAGVTGIIGTFTFTHARRHLGLERTGLLAFSIEILCLTLCVASVFLPGTLSQPGTFYLNTTRCLTTTDDQQSMVTNNQSIILANRSRRAVVGFSDSMTYSLPGHGQLLTLNPHLWNDAYRFSSFEEDIAVDSFDTHMIVKRDTGELNITDVDGNEASCTENNSLMSIMFFLIGIITSRVGLWMADLVVTQLLQENVLEKERGIVNGVQNSLNMLLDMFKNLLVIILPAIHTFGYLIIASFTFICIGGMFFAFHSWRVRGHLCHCHRIFPCCHPHKVPNAVNSPTKDIPANGTDSGIKIEMNC